VVGWALVWSYASRPQVEPPEPGPRATGRPRPVEPDRSPDFETVTDKTPVSFRDMAAYDTLLTRARRTPAAALATDARRDVLYAHLWGHPKDYRGVSVHLLGTARRVLSYPSRLSRTGWLYEAWVVTPESQNNPYVCVFEDVPEGFPVGADVSERVVFNGYFLKLLRYEAGDVPRAAPLLVGRLGWTPGPPAETSSNRSVYWIAAGVAVAFLISLARWSLHLRRSLSPRPRPALSRDRPTDELDPQALARWLKGMPEGVDPEG
jgi:hypothetical protein